MNTTSLFAELMVIGAGAMVWVVLLVLAVVGPPAHDGFLLKELAHHDNLWVFSMFLLTALTYVLGIIVDRFADWAFGYVARYYKKKGGFFLFETKAEAREAKTVLYEKSSPLREVFEYGRSRLRVCRGWTFNALFIGVTGAAVVVFQLAEYPEKGLLLFTVVAAFGLLTVGAFLAWRKLLKSESSRLYEQYQHLVAIDSKAPLDTYETNSE